MGSHSLLFQKVRASLIAQLVKTSPAIQDTPVDSWLGKIRWKRDRLPNPVFLGFPCASAGKESACNMGDLGWEDPLGRERLPTPVFWPGEFHGLQSIGSQRGRHNSKFHLRELLIYFA